MAERIAVAGAGPVGLCAALLLARHGHEVTVFEKREELSPASRASTFHPPTLDLLDRLGVLSEAEPLGRRIDEIHYYRCLLGRPTLAACFPMSLLAGSTQHPYRLHLEQALMTPLLLRALGACVRARVVFDAEVTALHQHDGVVDVVVRGGGALKPHRFDRLIGADGAHSAVRTAAGLAFDGVDYEKRVLRVMTPLDLRQWVPGLAGISYLYDGADSISLLEMRHVWRIIIRLPASISDEAALNPAFIARETARFLPLGEPLPIVSTDIYRTSQRVASAYGAGRVLLAGDAAHVTNTRGGMNMNCGLHDAWALAQAFAQADPNAALTRYAAERRAVVMQELIPHTDRLVDGGASWLAAVERISRDPERTDAFLRSAAMVDIAPPGLLTGGLAS